MQLKFILMSGTENKEGLEMRNHYIEIEEGH